jgi:hypothetical protein
MLRHPNDGIPFRTAVADVRLDSPIVELPSGLRMPALPLADGIAPALENGMFLRASVARCDVVAALAQFGLVPITREDFLEMTIVGLWTPARPLTGDAYGLAHMTSLGFSQKHDEAWWRDIQQHHAKDVDTFMEWQAWVQDLTLPVLCAKSHAASREQPLVVDRMVGGDKTDDHRPDLWQAGTDPNHVGELLVRDYWTKMYGKVPRASEKAA